MYTDLGLALKEAAQNDTAVTILTGKFLNLLFITIFFLFKKLLSLDIFKLHVTYIQIIKLNIYF